ncbi:MAG: ATP-binding protein [Ktedonobacterales bacterium]|nr:ATP-binding protein [Ktedonobacterales bacterium]
MREFRARLEARRATSAAETGQAASGTLTTAADICPLCGGAGYLRQELACDDPFFGQPVPCKCKERELEERRRQELDRFLSLKPFADKTFETFDPKLPQVREAYDIARRYASDPPGWLVISGSFGCGKTHLAAAIAHQRLATGSSVFFAVVPDLLDHLRAAFAPTSEITYDAMFDRIREVELLILDDLGAENGTAWAQEKLFQLINYRYNYRIPTVITTNNQLQSRMDERLRSRLADLSFVRHVVIKAPDHRPRNARRT